jgi:uncharacterized membrane protein
MGLTSRVASGVRLLRLAIAMLLLCSDCRLMAQRIRAGCVAEHYDVIALPLRPSHINEAGQVAGTTEGHRAALWSVQSGLRELPLPTGFYNSEAVGVNNSGHVVGVAYDRDFSRHRGFTFFNRVLTLLEGEQSLPFDISDSETIVGESLRPGMKTTGPVSWNQNTMRSLGGCCGGSAKGVNKNGETIGDVYNENGRYQAFLWNEHGGMQRIGAQDRYSSAIAITAQGDVVVQAFSGVFLLAGGSLVRLQLSPRYPSQPRAINNCDVIVGSFGPFADVEQAFIWERTLGFHDLNSRIASDSGWKLESAISINDHGEIVGRGDYGGQDDVGFLLVPTR